MSKILDLREWLSIDEAATHLTAAFGEPVTPADVLRLGLEDSSPLTLSVNFLNHANARIGKCVPLAQAKRVPGIPLPPDRKPREIVLGLQLDEDNVVQFEDPVRGPSSFCVESGLRILDRSRARWACGQAAFEPVHMPTGRC